MKSGSTQKPQPPGGLARYVRELRGKAGRHIRFGLMPRRPVIEIWAHRGCGEACLVCGESVLANEFEIEVCFEPDPLLGRDTPTFRFHHLCYSVWAAERVRLRQREERPGETPPGEDGAGENPNGKSGSSGKR